MVLNTFYDYERKILVKTTSIKLSNQVAEYADYLFSIKGINITTYLNEEYQSKNNIMIATDYLKLIRTEELN